mmetsp:Transcript_80074/g.259392  ORF Transcript_80074/g.259392 Transcript_80074/m.259392 type:complete len:205 (+) Transcript_80074:882-1496(+)
MKSEEKRPLHTWPSAISMKSGMTGFVMISNRSNCTAVAASCRAFTGTRFDQATHFQMPSGMVACPPSAGGFSVPARSSLLRRSFSSGVSFFLLWRMFRFGRSLSAARPARTVASAAGAAASSAGASAGSGLRALRMSSTKVQMRTTGKQTKCTTVGIGPMMMVVTSAMVPRMMPIRQRYKKNCLKIRKTKASQSTLSIVLKKPL